MFLLSLVLVLDEHQEAHEQEQDDVFTHNWPWMEAIRRRIVKPKYLVSFARFVGNFSM